MKYSWMGDRCVITADANDISLEEQSEFAKFYNNKLEEFRSLADKTNLKLPSVDFSDVEYLDDRELFDMIKWQKDDCNADKLAKSLTAVVVSPLILAAEGGQRRR